MNERTSEQMEYAGSGFCTHTLRFFFFLFFFLSLSLFLPPMHSPTHGWYLYYVKYNVPDREFDHDWEAGLLNRLGKHT